MELRINNIEKSFRRKKVLKDINIVLKPGIYGLLGPNGAGKTTLMRILTTILNFDNGYIRYGDLTWNKKDEVRKIIGYLPQKFSLYKSLSVVQALEYMAFLKGIRGDIKGEVLDVIQKVNLVEEKNKKIGQLSGGMIRRVGIAQAILGTPKIIIVDEPTAGLDPEERMRFRNLIKSLNGECIIIISTHIVEDVEMICENVAIMDKGNIILDGNINNMKDSINSIAWEIEITNNKYLDFQKKFKVTKQDRLENGYRVRIVSDKKPCIDAKQVKPTLEEIYLNLVSSHE